MFKQYVKYLLEQPKLWYSLKYPPVMSFKTYKNTVLWGETAIIEAKILAAERVKSNQASFKAISKKKLPIVAKVQKRLEYQPYMNKGKTLDEITKEHDEYVKTNPTEFDPDYVQNVKAKDFINLFYI